MSNFMTIIRPSEKTFKLEFSNYFVSNQMGDNRPIEDRLITQFVKDLQKAKTDEIKIVDVKFDGDSLKFVAEVCPHEDKTLQQIMNDFEALGQIEDFQLDGFRLEDIKSWIKEI